MTLTYEYFAQYFKYFNEENQGKTLMKLYYIEEHKMMMIDVFTFLACILEVFLF